MIDTAYNTANCAVAATASAAGVVGPAGGIHTDREKLMSVWRTVGRWMAVGLLIAAAWASGCASNDEGDVRGSQAAGYVEPEPGDTTELDSVRPQVPKMY
ncbi:MAG TPA: hypothetical protein PLS23_18165 [Phycisphaerae bacterium]|nr:hypothetical protein [Phycisphaerae bacterium]